VPHLAAGLARRWVFFRRPVIRAVPNEAAGLIFLVNLDSYVAKHLIIAL
jgi:hypothetical protein